MYHSIENKENNRCLMIKSHLVPFYRSPTGNSELIVKGLIVMGIPQSMDGAHKPRLPFTCVIALLLAVVLKNNPA